MKDNNGIATTTTTIPSSSSSSKTETEMEKWTLMDKIGWVEARLTQPANWRQTYEPIFVLQKQTEIVVQ